MSSLAQASAKRSLFDRLHLDLPMLIGILLLMGFGLVVMYSASGQSMVMMERQAMRMLLALAVMFALAQVPPRHYEFWFPLFIRCWCGVISGGIISRGNSQRSTALA